MTRGCPFAAALAFMKGEPLDLEIVDHMGPKLAILEEHHLNRVRRNLDYIYVGDFVVGGGCYSTLSPGASCSLSVTFRPASSGTRSAVVGIQANLVSGQSVSVSGTGLVKR